MTGSRYVLPLDELRVTDADAVGRKAANLGELHAAGLPVPPGHVLTAAALHRVLDHCGPLDDLPPEVVAERLSKVDLPPDVLAALEELAVHTADQPVAVRSSSAAEDLPGHSYAGQYESVLDVVGRDALHDSVRVCWSSAFSARVTSYQRDQGLDGAGQLCVLVQRMVPADAAGVAFSANPVTGARGETLVSAVRGLGDRLVSGLATPDEWVVSNGAARQETGDEDAITGEQALAVAALARKAEAYFGQPQDIEWAVADGTLWLLQSRPITALPDEPVEVPVVVPDGHWQRSGHSARPLTPMARSIKVPVLNDAIRNLFSFMVADRLEFAEIGGWLYTQFHLPAGRSAMFAKIRRLTRTTAAGEPGKVFRRWHEQWWPEISGDLRRLRRVDLPGLNDDDLVAHLGETLALSRSASEVHFRIGGAGIFAVGQLGLACRDLLGSDVGDVLGMLTGLPSKTTEPSYRLAALADRAQEIPAVDRALHEPGCTLEDVRAADAGVGEALADFLDEYGTRTVGIELDQPTMAEQPSVVISLLRAHLDGSYDAAGQAAMSDTERERLVSAARSRLTGDRLVRYDSALRLAQQGYPLRDDTVYASQCASALVRTALLELGRRLATSGGLAEAGDVFMLERDEAVTALRAGTDVRSLVRRRRAETAWVERHPGPAEYGRRAPAKKAAQVAMKLMPARVRRAVQPGFFVWQEVWGDKGRTGDVRPGDLQGIAASRGRYTGIARIIRDQSEFGKLQAGDVLVCPETTAEWSVLFPMVGALVTDQGGLLSHPAIIAREYRVPAVLATGDATSRIPDGAVVTVDGTAGVVELTA